MMSYRSVLLEGCVILGLLGVCWAGENHADGKEKVEKLGCVFENDEYYVPTKSVYLPVYGKVVIEPMEFANLEEFEVVLNVIKAEYSKVISEFVLTNIPVINDFYDLYQKHSDDFLNESPDDSSEDFDDSFDESYYDFSAKSYEIEYLFKNFVPKFYPRQDSAGITIELLDRLVKIYPKMSRSVHLVTASEHINSQPNELLRKLQILKFWEASISGNSSRTTEEPFRMLFKHSHVAGLLRIRLEGSRIGHVLMDPGFGTQNYEAPVVMMEDGEAPHQTSPLNVFTDGGIDTHFYFPRHDYLVAVHHEGGNQIPKTIYYLGRPFCSFRMTTTKMDVLAPYPMVLRKDPTGLPKALLLMDSFTDKAEDGRQFGFFVFNTHNYTSRIENPFWTVNFGEREYEGDQERYEDFVGKLNYPGVEELLTKAETIAENDEFTADLRLLMQKSIFVEHSFKDERTIPF